MASLAASLRLPLLFAIAIGTFACRTAPLYTPEDVALEAPGGAKLSKVAASIKEAGASLGWVMKEQSPGVITGVLDKRRHHCEVQVLFDAKKFSIYYRSSENLRYDAATATIHKAYNKWVQNLERRIVERSALIPG